MHDVRLPTDLGRRGDGLAGQGNSDGGRPGGACKEGPSPDAGLGGRRYHIIGKHDGDDMRNTIY
ncbi:hypothetical protein GCM10010530_58020 [Kribbella aluminosa]